MTDTQMETPKDFGPDEPGKVRRWLRELSMSEKRDKVYRKRGKEIWDKYRNTNRKKNSFNILWANTEVIAPAVFNSAPKPDVRRRFRDADPLGKQASEALRRAIEFAVDTEKFDGSIRWDVLDMLLPGRGVSRVRYIPSIMESAPDEDSEESEDPQESEGYEELEWEQVCIEHVQWDAFRLGPGKTWSEICWVAFNHRMTRGQLTEKFGEKGKKLKLDSTGDDDLEKLEDKDREIFQTASVWEIWDKDDKKVRFVSEANREQFLDVQDDPLELIDFFPIPRPIYAINDSSTMDPVPLYEQYREQGQELDRVSGRINKLIDACKYRGIYDATLAEFGELIRGDDNDLIPAQSATRFVESGFDKAIWMLPVDKVAAVLAVLYQQREATKQVIYELTGISDILRGATDPNETLGAQQIKAQSGSQRIGEMQRDTARYVRDLIRMMAEIIGQKFQMETLQKMTGMNLPTEQEVQMQMMQMQQQMAMSPPQPGQPPPQMPPKPITWEAVIAVLRDDAQRTMKVDVETDSTIAAAIQDDMQSLRDVIGGISEIFTALGPVVQQGAMPLEALKELVMAVTRRAKLGNAVEDAFDQIQEPPQQADPAAQAEQAKAQAQQQAEQQKLQAQQASEQARMQADMQIEQFKSQAEERMQAMQMQHEAQLEAQRLAQEESLQRWQAQQEMNTKLLLAAIQKETAIEVAEINAESEGNDFMEALN
ncbi:hypothetical protein UFOVP1165_59 [uncultured Caudovirales phage]|uniref:Portal protein n=1 Tax=uncultured Caudovirales phage TaxID=2100421 RepID=A0A6J5R0K7_9CAUD|nr:hypothetical protein UFOVP1165_59 [uncultured Caudovirales phage]